MIQDALLDPRFKENILVTGPPYIRFYCGLPLMVGGYKLGTLCVIDTKPRAFTREDFIRVVNAMEQLSRVVVRALDPSQLPSTVSHAMPCHAMPCPSCRGWGFVRN